MQDGWTWGAPLSGIDAAASPAHSLGDRSGWYLAAEPARPLGDSTMSRPNTAHSLLHPWAVSAASQQQPRPVASQQQQPRPVPWYNRPLEDFSAPRAAGAATILPTQPNNYLRLEPAAAHCVHNDAVAGAVPSAALQHAAEDRAAAHGAAQPTEVHEDEVICTSDDDEPSASTAPLDERPLEREPASRGHSGLALPADAGAHSDDEEEAGDDAPPRSGGRYFGVSKSNKGYRAATMHIGKMYYGGGYTSPQEAARAYDALLREHKLPKPLNFPTKAEIAAVALPRCRAARRTVCNLSGYFGVIKLKKGYKVLTQCMGKKYNGGTHTSPQKAARAYDALVREHKLPKPLNFPNDAEPAAAERIAEEEEEEEEPHGQVASAGALPSSLPRSAHPRSAAPLAGAAPPRSGYFGVYKNGKCYLVQTWHIGKTYYGGRYTSPQEAARAYDALVRERRLPRPLNFPGTKAVIAAGERIVEEEEPQGQVASVGAVRGRYPKRKHKSFASGARTQDGELMPSGFESDDLPSAPGTAQKRARDAPRAAASPAPSPAPAAIAPAAIIPAPVIPTAAPAPAPAGIDAFLRSISLSDADGAVAAAMRHHLDMDIMHQLRAALLTADSALAHGEDMRMLAELLELISPGDQFKLRLAIRKLPANN